MAMQNNPIGTDPRAGGIPLIRPGAPTPTNIPDDKIDHAAGVAGAVPLTENTGSLNPTPNVPAAPGGFATKEEAFGEGIYDPSKSALPASEKGKFKLVRGPAPGDKICA